MAIYSMKRALLILAILLCAPQQVSAGSLTKAPNNLGLVGYWSFNEGTGLKAGDFSGYGTHGTLTNGPTWAGGRFGGGLNFDGVNDLVQTTSGVSITSDFTYSFWMKPSQNAAGVPKGIMGNLQYGGSPYGVSLLQEGEDLLVYWNANPSFYTWTSKIPTINTWYHVVLQYQSGVFSLFINGAIQSGTATQAIVQNNTKVTIGRWDQDFASYYFQGSIDDVRVYNRALGAGEVARMYAGGGASKIQSAQSEAGTGLVGHWKLDDRAGTRATDSSGRGNHGTLTGFNFTGATSNWISGRLGGGLNFDGTNDYISTPSMTSYASTNSHTYSAWVRVDGAFGTSAFGYGWVINGSVAGAGSSLILNSNKVGFFYNGGSAVYGGNAIVSSGVWHHIVTSYDSTTGRVTLYLDGVLDTTSSVLTAWSAGTGYRIGSYNGSNFFNGPIDDVRIYNTALTAQQVKTLYASGTARPAIANANSASLTAGTNLASGLVGHWSFDGKYLSPTTARDTSGQGNDGTLTNGPAVAIGKMGQALSFDGGNDYIRLPPISIPSAITVSAWVHSLNFNQTGMIVMKQPVNAQWGIFFNNDSLLYWRGGGITAITCAAPSNNTWHHVVAKQTGTTATLYIDGSQCATGSVDAIANGTTASTNDILISTYNGSSYPFSGSIDDVRVYNRALSATEVKQLYYLGK